MARLQSLHRFDRYSRSRQASLASDEGDNAIFQRAPEIGEIISDKLHGFGPALRAAHALSQEGIEIPPAGSPAQTLLRRLTGFGELSFA
jgi:hypothetical protein